MDAKGIQTQIYEHYVAERDRRDERKSKQSFWASDCLKPLNELYWAWTNTPKTNPCSPETLSMFDIGKLCELHVIKRLQEIGFAANLDEDADRVIKVLGPKYKVADEPDEFGHKQLRMEMEREYVPITGYLDGITLNGEPIEVKSTRSQKYIRDVATGNPPQIEHVHQLACYMDYLDSRYGYLIVVSRPDGIIMVVKVENLGDGQFMTIDHSLGLPEQLGGDGKPTTTLDGEPMFEPLLIDLGAEFKRWRRLFEDHIHQLREPPLEFEYRPKITKKLLQYYVTENGDDTKIRKAIKGERVLSDHLWKYQYSDWKDLVIQKEMKAKGFDTIGELCEYTDEEKQLMLDFIGCEMRPVMSGKSKGQMRIYKKK